LRFKLRGIAASNFIEIILDLYAAGQSEVMLGELLGKHWQDVVIATKVGFRAGGAAPTGR
jgi:hypothetical protein